MFQNPKFQRLFIMSGLAPYLLKYSGQQYCREVRMEVAFIVVQLFCSTLSTLKLFISGGGITVLAKCLDLNMEENQDINVMTIDCINSLIHSKVIMHIDLLTILVQHGVPERVTVAIDTLAHEADDPHSYKYLQIALDILCAFSEGQPLIQENICSNDIIPLLFEISRYIDLPCLLKVCSIMKNLANNQLLLNRLENVGIIPFCGMLIKRALDWECDGVQVKPL
jgi:hypothetical protein